MKHSKGIVTIPNITGDIDVNVNIEILPIELYTGDASKYIFNTAMNTSTYTQQALQGRYLTNIIPVDFTRRKCLSIYGAEDGYLANNISIFKVLLYKAGVAKNVIWVSNFYPNHNATEGHVDLSTFFDDLETYDGIQFEIGMPSSPVITANNIATSNQLSIKLCAEISADVTAYAGYTFGQIVRAKDGIDSSMELEYEASDEFVYTGVIEIAPGDTIRIKGMLWFDNNTNGHCCIIFYKEDKVYSGKVRTIYKGYSSTGITYSFYDTDGDGIDDVVEIHATEEILNNHGDYIENFKTTGIAVCGRKGRDENLIIARNLTIEKDLNCNPNDFNALPFSINTDGTDFIGKHTNGGDGYEYGYRIDSNGNLISCEGMYVSGYIPACSLGQLYIKNIEKYTADESYNTIAFYNRYNKGCNGCAILTESSSILKYGNGTFRINPSTYSGNLGTYYFRFCCGGITENTRVSSSLEIPHYTNLSKPNPTNSTDTALWVNGFRVSGSAIVQDEGAENTTLVNYIKCNKGDVIRIKGATFRDYDKFIVYTIRADDVGHDTAVGYISNGVYSGDIPLIVPNDVSDGVYTFTVDDSYGGDIIGFRFAMQKPENPNSVVITINEEIAW